MFNIDNATIDFQCPQCGFYNTATIKHVRLADVVICRGCKANIHLDDKDKSVSKLVRDLKKSIKELENSFGSK